MFVDESHVLVCHYSKWGHSFLVTLPIKELKHIYHPLGKYQECSAAEVILGQSQTWSLKAGSTCFLLLEYSSWNPPWNVATMQLLIEAQLLARQPTQIACLKKW